MSRDLTGWSIVLVGAWNPAILSPSWITQHVLNRSGTNVEMFLGMGVADQRRFRFPEEGITFVVEPARLTVLPKSASDECLSTVENVAKKILAVLPHTPVRAAGVNYLYSATVGVPAIDDVLSSLRDASRLTTLALRASRTEIIRTLTGVTHHGTPVLKLKFVSDLESGRLSADFNYHYNVKTADEAHSRVEGALTALRDHSKAVLTAYDVDVEIESEADNIEGETLVE